MVTSMRTNYNGDLRISDVGKNVSVCGWVSKKRNLGGVIFIDLRDRPFTFFEPNALRYGEYAIGTGCAMRFTTA